jgi:hypothetical protein
MYGVFFRKGLKKIKFEKGVPIGKNSKNRYLPLVDQAGGVGPGIPAHPAGGRFQDY